MTSTRKSKAKYLYLAKYFTENWLRIYSPPPLILTVVCPLERPQKSKNKMRKSKENSEHYKWGDNCSGWHLVKSENLSIIEELIPPKTQEKKHYHNISNNFLEY